MNHYFGRGLLILSCLGGIALTSTAHAEPSIRASLTYEPSSTENGLTETLALGGIGESGRFGFDFGDDETISTVFIGWGQLGGMGLSEAPSDIELAGTDFELGYTRYNEAFKFLGGQTYFGLDLRTELSSVSNDQGESNLSGDVTVMPSAKWQLDLGERFTLDLRGSLAAIAFSVNAPDDEATDNGNRRVLMAIGDVAIPTDFVRVEVYSELAYNFKGDWSVGLWRLQGTDGLRADVESHSTWQSTGLSLAVVR